MRYKNLDLITAIFIAIVNVGWTQIPNRPVAVGIILALPLIFILPGYALTQTLFHKYFPVPDTSNDLILRPILKLGQPMNGADHLILSIGLSIAIDVLVGYTLNFFPIGLQAVSWTVSLGLIITGLALLVAFIRRKDDTVDLAIQPMQGHHISIRKYIVLALAILVATIAIWTAIIRPPATQNFYTQFWMLPSKQIPNSCAISIGVQNFEQASTNYRITITENDVPVTTWSSVTLAPKEEWAHVVTVPIASTKSIYVEAKLYKSDSLETVYRNVHLTLHVPSTNKSKSEQAQQCT